MEYIVLYDAKGRDTGFVQPRDGGVCAGAYYQVVSVLTRDEEGRFLTTRRSGCKAYFPHCWEITGGCVQAGEDSRTAAARELREETGLVPRHLEYLGCYSAPTLTDGAFFRVEAYQARVAGRAPAVKMQEGEVEEYRWVTAGELQEVFRSQPAELLSPLTWKYYQEKEAGRAGKGGNDHE